MNKGTAIDLILLQVNGGKLSLDNAVKAPEVSAYLDTAFASALKQSVFESLGLDRTIVGSSPISPTYGVTAPIYSSFKGTPVKDTNRNLYRLDLPPTLPLINDWHIQVVYPEKNPNVPYVRLRTATSMAGAENLIQDMYHVETNAIYFHNFAVPACSVIAMIAKSVSSLTNEDEIPYPDEVIAVALNVAAEWFSRQAATPADNIANNKATNEMGNA